MVDRPRGPLRIPRLTSVGPLVDSPWEDAIRESDPDVNVYFKSSESMEELDDGSVHLMATSPPYNLGWNYGSFDDRQEYKDYLSMMDSVIDETYRVLVDQGRACINVPILVRQGAEGGVSHLKDMLEIMEQQQNDWRMREIIVWDKGSSPPPDYSTFPEPWGVLLNNLSECIIVAQKPGRRRGYNRPSDKIRDVSTLDRSKEPNDITQDVWEIQSIDKSINIGGERIPMYPREIPERLIKLYSYITDTILDPFAGSGRTLGVARELGRNGVGYEVREELAPVIEDEIGVEMEMI